jgi:hypothetical protein
MNDPSKGRFPQFSAQLFTRFFVGNKQLSFTTIWTTPCMYAFAYYIWSVGEQACCVMLVETLELTQHCYTYQQMTLFLVQMEFAARAEDHRV